MHLPSLLAALVDGRFHSGAALAVRFGVTRAAVWKAVRQLEALGLPISGVRGRGYRLQWPLEMLDAQRVRAGLTPAGREYVSEIAVHLVLDSTNAWLRGRASLGAPAGSVALAEAQHGGRGRAGRQWHSPLTGNLYLSVLWRFDHPPSRVGTLSLALGVAVARALSACGVDGIELKWPNDLVWRGHKLGGLLLEATAEAAGPCVIVAGLGLNVFLPERNRARIDQASVDLLQIAPDVARMRNHLAATLVDSMVAALATFADSGFEPYEAEWARRDAVRGREVEVRGPGGVARGRAQGIDADGALQVIVDGVLRSYSSGDVSVRAA